MNIFENMKLVFKGPSCEGFKYKDIKKSVSIIIAAGHNVIEDKRYFHKYNMSDEKDNSMFSDLLDVDLPELKKLPQNDDVLIFGIG